MTSVLYYHKRTSRKLKMSAPPEEDRFAANVIDLSDLVHELVSQCWDSGIRDINPILLIAAKAYLQSYNRVELIRTFIQYSHMYWDEIHDRSEEFFITHSHSVFAHIPVGKGNIDAFKMLFTSKDPDGEFIIGPEDRDAIITCGQDRHAGTGRVVPVDSGFGAAVPGNTHHPP